MTDYLQIFDNHNLKPLQKENSNLNIREFLGGDTVLKSYPRRIIVELSNSGSSPFLNPGLLENIRPAFSYAEEISLISFDRENIPDNLQSVLEFSDEFNISKSITSDISVIRDLSPWIFQYQVARVNLNIGNNINIFSDNADIASNLRELVVRKYFAPVKPYINIVADISSISKKEIEQMMFRISDAGADGVVMYNSDYIINEHPHNPVESYEEHIALMSEIKDKSELYGIDVSLPGIPTESDKDCFYYPNWSDLFIGFNAMVRSHCSKNSDVTKIPSLGTSFIDDFWNSSDMIALRKKDTGFSIDDRISCNGEIYKYRACMNL